MRFSPTDPVDRKALHIALLIFVSCLGYLALVYWRS